MKAVKSLVLLLFISNITYAQVQDLSNPRMTMKTFLKNMVIVKTQKKDIDKAYQRAISTFDLTDYGKNIQTTIGEKFATDLIFTLDRLEKINYEDIPQEPKGDTWVFDKRHAKGQTLIISISKLNDKWKFNKETLESLASYKNLLQSQKTVKGVGEFNSWRDRLRSKIPTSLKKQFLNIELWQWLALFIIILIAFILEKIAGFIAQFLVNKNFKIFDLSTSDHLKNAINPFRKLLFVFLLIPGIQLIDLPASYLKYSNRILYIAASIITVWLAHRIVEMVAYYFSEAASRTETKFDDIIIPLLTKTTFVLVYIIGGILVAYNFSVDVTGLLAGLGIGGLAFAFAAKDTLANFFGSIMLILDRPFDIGDYITAGDLDGIVEEVGFRSTRIRTFYDSVITISNGELVNRSIDNKGKRRYRRLNTTLGVEYDTPPEKVEEFCEGIRQLVLSYNWTRKDNFHVYFVNYGNFSLDIQLMVFWETDDYAREQQEKHRLMIDILRLSKDIGVNFAFPTQTLHMFKENGKAPYKIEEKYLDTAIEKAKRLAQKPFTLKNPRSNGTDVDQFGKNDF